jgi:hypothetical protein
MSVKRSRREFRNYGEHRVNKGIQKETALPASSLETIGIGYAAFFSRMVETQLHRLHCSYWEG